MNHKQRENLQRKRLQHQLTLQSMQIERVFDRHKIDAQVSGGRAGVDGVRFDLQAQLSSGLERLVGLTRDLKDTLRAPKVVVDDANGRLNVHVPSEELPVPLLDLVAMLPDLPPLTAVLGISEENQPVLMQFRGGEAGHVLVAGTAGAGKTTLLRTIALSLALTNRQSRLQLIVMRPETPGEQDDALLAPLDYLPHMLATVIRRVDEAVDVLSFLADEAAYRREQQVQSPVVVVLIDRATTLLETADERLKAALVKLLQTGPDTGIFLVLSTRRPKAGVWGQLLPAYVPLRIVGQVADAAEAQAATGVADTQATYLLGAGDFLAVNDEGGMRFQAAAVSEYDLHLSVQELHRSRPQPLLARPVGARLAFEREQGVAEPAAEVVFAYNGQSVAMVDELPADEGEPDDDWIDLEA